MGRPPLKSTGPMTAAERQARRRKRVGKSMNRQRRTARKLAKEAKSREASRARYDASRNAAPLPDGMELRIGDARLVLGDIEPNSVPLILTDPPYGVDAAPLYAWLAEFAARVLIPGGSLVCYTGQSCLNRDIALFDRHLTYFWLLTMPHQQSQRLLGRGVIVNFKPALWFVKGFRRGPRTLLPDVLLSPKRDKSARAWGQGEGGVQFLIEHLTKPGELIVDPFAGTATWGEIAASMGRRWIGCDVVDGGDTVIEATPIPNLPAPIVPVPASVTWHIPPVSPANRAALSRLCRQVPIDRGIMPVAA